MNTFKYLMVASAAVLAAACASAPKAIPELDAARMEVRQAGSDPLAQEAAGVRLKKAEVALQAADTAVSQHKPPTEIRHQAYVATRQAQIAEQQTSELRSRKEVEQGEAERNRVLLEARTSEAGKAEAAANAAKNDANAARSDAMAQSAQADAARQQLADASMESARLRTELEALNAKQTDRGMVLTLGDVLFDTAKTDLKGGASLTMDRVADFLRSRPTLNLLIEGHTDSVGTDEYNVDLSQRRAETVSRALVSRGIAADRVQTHGLGKSYPVASNDTASGRQQNRRVEVIFSDDKGQFSPAAERLTRS